VRCDDRNGHSRVAGLHLVDLHPFGKREQWVSFHHDLVSLSTQSDGPFWKEVYHTFSLLLISAIPDSPKSAMSRFCFTESSDLHSTLRFLTAYVVLGHIRELNSFVSGLERDKAAVLAGLTLPESNGQTEGHITKLKLIKRMMYGRAGFPLLRQRMLHCA